ncbi:MAG: substrate-binding domain-containing protein [Chloroflexota bacterium]
MICRSGFRKSWTRSTTCRKPLRGTHAPQKRHWPASHQYPKSFLCAALTGIEEVVRAHGYNLLVATCHPDMREGSQLPLGMHNTDGLLAFADSLDEDDIRQFYDREFPLVLIHRTPANDLAIPFVTVENKAATRHLVEHLITVHGRSRIILMGGPEQQEDSYWREVGYKAALSANGIAYDPALVLRGSFQRAIAYANRKHSWPIPIIRHSMPSLPGMTMPPLAFTTPSKGERLPIPDEVSVVGFDDSQLSQFLTPPLTTVRAPTGQVGRSAAEQLFRLLAGEVPEREICTPPNWLFVVPAVVRFRRTRMKM